MTSQVDADETEAAAVQKLWADFITNSMRAGWSCATEPLPPESYRELRSEFFQSLSASWDTFLRSPQFLDAMKQVMDQTIAARKITNDFLGNVRHEMQAPSREDVDAVMVAVRHMEKRILDRLETTESQVRQLAQAVSARPAAKKPARARGQSKVKSAK
jgi:hypothetical protein